MTATPRRILAVASSGGHWEQLMQIRPAFEGADVVWATTDVGQVERYGLTRFELLKDYNQSDPVGVARGLVETRRVVGRIRPDVVISTGAAPGLLCLVWGRRFGAHTIWLDSIANAERLSLSGRLAMRVADQVLTQWEHLATETGRPAYWGNIL